MKYPVVQLHPQRVKSVAAGHPWIFSGGLKAPKDISPGSPVFLGLGERILGTGYYNPNTDIAVRLLAFSEQVLDERFFRKRFQQLREMKEAFLPSRTNGYRVVFGEADGCPGLIVDKYADVLVAQFHTLGMDRLKKPISRALQAVFQPRSIVERSDVANRAREGLTDKPVGILLGEEIQEVVFLENGFQFLVHPLTGQKTGFFLDQRDNRQTLSRYSQGRRVLNVFSYTGGFSVYAARNAESVASLDSSRPAMEVCRKNFELNELNPERHGFHVQDAFQFLQEMPSDAYDLVVLDPPSFAKNRHQMKNAVKAYTTINSKALEKLPVGGLLVSSSCTSFIDSMTFMKILHQSAVNAGCGLRLLESKEQAHDHAYNFAVPESKYLKFMVCLKTDRT